LQSFCPVSFRIEVEQKRVRPGEVSKMCGSNRKLRRVTGWKPEYSLAHTLWDLYEFWKSVAIEKHDSHGWLVRQQ
jgi:nucleoside-diphosphate-sugar epimerase